MYKRIIEDNNEDLDNREFYNYLYKNLSSDIKRLESKFKQVKNKFYKENKASKIQIENLESDISDYVFGQNIDSISIVDLLMIQE